MANPAHMNDHFESEKNRKASGYTAMICTLIGIILFFVTWTLPTIPLPPLDEGIEVNLGNSDQGLGTNQPFLPGKPSPQDQEKYTPPKQTVVEHTPAKEVETDDKNEDAPVIKKPAITKPDATKIPIKDVAVTKPVKAVQPVVMPAPPKPKPKAVFHGVNGTGTGGNDADDYKPGSNQGVAGGKGDQGAPGGNPNSNNYKGNGGAGNSGAVSILRGLQGRKIISFPSFTDDFNENGRVAINIHVDGAGNVIKADFNQLGSSTSESSPLVAIAIRKAKQLKLNGNPSGDESVGTILFILKLNN